MAKVILTHLGVLSVLLTGLTLSIIAHTSIFQYIAKPIKGFPRGLITWKTSRHATASKYTCSHAAFYPKSCTTRVVRIFAWPAQISCFFTHAICNLECTLKWLYCLKKKLKHETLFYKKDSAVRKLSTSWLTKFAIVSREVNPWTITCGALFTRNARTAVETRIFDWASVNVTIVDDSLSWK